MTNAKATFVLRRDLGRSMIMQNLGQGEAPCVRLFVEGPEPTISAAGGKDPFFVSAPDKDGW